MCEKYLTFRASRLAESRYPSPTVRTVRLTPPVLPVRASSSIDIDDTGIIPSATVTSTIGGPGKNSHTSDQLNSQYSQSPCVDEYLQLPMTLSYEERYVYARLAPTHYDRREVSGAALALAVPSPLVSPTSRSDSDGFDSVQDFLDKISPSMLQDMQERVSKESALLLLPFR